MGSDAEKERSFEHALDEQKGEEVAEFWWNQNSVKIIFNAQNPRTTGSKAYEKYEKYKAAETVGQAKALGAITTDLKFYKNLCKTYKYL